MLKFIVLMILGGLIGIGFAPYEIGISISLGQMLPMEKVAAASGKCFLFMGIGAVVGPVSAGYIYDNTKDHKIILFLEALGLFIGGITCFTTAFIHNRQKRERQLTSK